MKVHIQSPDGTTVRTIVSDVETGEPIKRVQRVHWTAGIDDARSECHLVISNAPIDAVAELSTLSVAVPPGATLDDILTLVRVAFGSNEVK